VDLGNATSLELVFDVHSARGIDQLVQMSVGQLATFTTELLGAGSGSRTVMLKQAAPADAGGHPGIRIEYGARCDGILLASKWLRRRPHFDEQAMQRHFREFIHALEKRYPDSLKDQVREIIGQLLPSGECTVARVAATLDVQPRVLQKRLRSDGTSYSDLLREMRLQIAEQHLRARSMGITDLALNLGYAEVSVFTRNFKQWTGLSPRAWQQRHLS
jgi:AraC-like DNA-binding protein